MSCNTKLWDIKSFPQRIFKCLWIRALNLRVHSQSVKLFFYICMFQVGRFFWVENRVKGTLAGDWSWSILEEQKDVAQADARRGECWQVTGRNKVGDAGAGVERIKLWDIKQHKSKTWVTRFVLGKGKSSKDFQDLLWSFRLFKDALLCPSKRLTLLFFYNKAIINNRLNLHSITNPFAQ